MPRPLRAAIFLLKPLGQAARIVPDVRVAELLKQADRLRAERSRWAATVDDDGRLKVGDDRAGPSRDFSEGEVHRAWDVRGRKRLGREHIEKHGALASKHADELVAGNTRHRLNHRTRTRRVTLV